MEPKNPLRHLLVIIVSLLPLAYLAMQWSAMPETVATHFGIDGKPDAYGSKKFILGLSIFMSVINFIVYLVVINAHKLDKKRTKGIKPANFDTIAVATVIFMAIINLGIIINSRYPDAVLVDKVLLPVIGLFFVFLGNLMYNIKPNRFVGVRIPWTLNDDDNWKHTHRVASKLFFVAGLLITLVALGYETKIAMIFFSIIVLVITIATVLYSYLFYRKNKKHNLS